MDEYHYWGMGVELDSLIKCFIDLIFILMLEIFNECKVSNFSKLKYDILFLKSTCLNTTGENKQHRKAENSLF